mgnify:FL=1
MSDLKMYSAFGLAISSDISLPELPEHPDPDTALETISISRSNHESWQPLQPSEHSTSTVQMSNDDWRLEIEGIGWFRVYKGRQIMWQQWDDSVSNRDIRTFLVSSAIGALMIQKNSLILCATSVVKEGKAILLLGEPASGKSTLAYFLQQNGWQLLSSEISYVDNDGMVWPGIQQLKLWLDTIMEIGINKNELPVVRKGLKRYALMPPNLSIANKATALTAIYDVNRQRKEKDKCKDDEGNKNNIYAWKVLEQQRALLIIRNRAFQPRFYRGMGKEQKLFLYAASLAKKFRLHRLLLPDNIQEMKAALKDVNLLDPLSLHPEKNQMLIEPNEEKISKGDD